MNDIDKHIEANDNLCRETAIKNNYTWQQADECDNGSLQCSGCPWGERELERAREMNEIESQHGKIKINPFF